MKYAFFPGCVSRGGAPELYQSVMHVCKRLGIELEEMTSASCTGAGVLQEKNRKLGDALNARNFALAEQLGLPIMTICSTCQGVMSQANKRLRDNPEYLAEINQVLAEEKLEYKGTTDVKHLLWVLLEDIGEEELKSHMIFPLSELRIAPFYGCYILRPSDALGFEENPQRQQSLETIISLVGAEVVDFPGKTKCCGFPILTINERNSLRMVAKHTGDAQDLGAEAMVTPCPLCHLNLDGFQPKAARQNSRKIDLPILHLPQMIGLAMGMDGETMGMRKHIISPKKILKKTGIPT